MAKGNMLLGYSRGSVGDVTFYRDGGEQRARARNRKPNNPRSNRQMYQRAKFAGAVKFFKQSYANFYRMAFENKKPNESDYNAFMRMNLAQSPLMSKSAFDKPGYPAIGHWTIAQGSMPTLQFFKNYGTGEDKLAVVLPVQTEETISNNTTIGEFSTILINSGLYQPGDIFTVVRVRVDADVATLATLPTATPEGNWNSYWFVTQIILDTADTRKVGTELLREDAGEMLFKNSDGNIYIANGGDDGFSLVTTRNTPNGLKASNSEIVVTDTIDTAITTAEGDNYKNAVLADWRANGENILQGALAAPFESAVISRHWLTVETDDDDKVLQLITGTQDYIASIDGYINSVVIDFEGERLPSLDPSTITSDITFTATHDFDSNQRQFVRLTFSSPVNAVNLSFSFAGQNYVCHIYRGATIEGIANGPNTPVQPPISETWTGSTTARTYLLVQKAGEVVINRNWDIPPQIASTEVIITQDGSNYTARINPVADPPAGNYVIKYCNQPLINVTVN